MPGSARSDVLFAAALVLVLAGAGCDRAPATDPTNLVMVSLDTTRSDRMSAYGYELETTPHLRSFTARAARFEAAYAPAASTNPSHATVFTSLPPFAHGVRRNGMRLHSDHETLAERLQRSGFQTAGVVSSFPLDADFGLAQGFRFYDDDFASDEATIAAAEWQGREVMEAFDRRADYVTDRALHWLRETRDPDAPFFLFVHYFDPHLSYDPPEPFRTRFLADLPAKARPLQRLSALYDGEIAFTDQELGRLLEGLEELGLSDDTLVVVFGDHGEGLLEHGFLGHGVNLYEPAVRVPLLILGGRAQSAGQKIAEPVGLIDLAPTVLELLGLPLDPALEGASLAPALRGEANLDPDRPVYLFRMNHEPNVKLSALGTPIRVHGEGYGIRMGPWKYLEEPVLGRRELFHIGKDPGEQRNLLLSRPLTADRLAKRLEQWRGQEREVAPLDLSPDERRALEALGYLD